jgi:uncharacterized protein (TIGR02588 family)
MSNAVSKRQAGQERAGSRSVAEWVTFAVAALILAAVAGLVIYDWFATPMTPPVLAVSQSGAVERVGDQYRIAFEVRNDGGDTAEAVQVIAELQRDGEIVADGEQQIDFLSPGESEEGAFLFGEDPASGELTLRVASYKEP